jgi:hypothetical protein
VGGGQRKLAFAKQQMIKQLRKALNKADHRPGSVLWGQCSTVLLLFFGPYLLAKD